MRNLKLCRNNCWKIPTPVSRNTTIITDAKESRVFYVTDNRLYWFSSPSDTGSIPLKIADGLIIDIEYVLDSVVLLLPRCKILRVTVPAENVTVDYDKIVFDDDNEKFEATAMFWNHTRDRVVFLRGFKVAVITTAYFQPLRSIDLYSDEKVTRPSVGWGQKATQFKGYRNNKLMERVDEGTSQWFDSDTTTYVTWRKDGGMFAVNYQNTNSRERKIKIFTNEGVLQYISEDNSALEGPISWKPSMGFIAGVQAISAETRQICLLEQNALYHCSFELPPSFEVKQLLWNSNSDILAVYCIKTAKERSEFEEGCVLLWVTSNCTWYLKQCLNFTERIYKIMWDSYKPYRLHIVHSAVYKFYEWDWEYSVSHSYHCKNYSALIVSINGSSCELTAPMKSLIPPPMFSFRIPLEYPADAVIFPHGRCFERGGDINFSNFSYYNSFIAVMKRNLLNVYVKKDNNFVNVNRYRLEWQRSKNETTSNWFWKFPDTLYFEYTTISTTTESGIFLCVVKLSSVKPLRIGTNGSVPKTICLFNIEGSPYTWKSLFVETMIPVPSNISAIANYSEGAVIHCVDGSFRFVNSKGLVITEILFGNELILSYNRIELTNVGLIGLTGDGRLICDNIELAENVTSFIWSSPYLLYISADYTLKIVVHKPGNNNDDDDNHRDKNHHPYCVMDRKLEMGTRIVMCVGSTLILQHARGNVETIVPRPFVLSYLHWMLKRKLYLEAFYFLRKMRVSYNMLFDHNPKTFLQNVDVFLDKMRDADVLKAFIDVLDSKCHATDVYGAYYSAYPKYDVRSKLAVICDALINVMEKANENGYSPTIITCLVKCGKVQEAVRFAKRRNLLSFLLKLVNGRNLFQAALSCYELDLATTIAKMAQLDPKDYQSTLAKLGSLTENSRRFHINEMAGNFEEALRYLILDEDHPPVDYEQFIKDHNLYSCALRLAKDSGKYRDVCILYAKYLYDSKSYEESALLSETVGRYENAVDAFSMAGRWEEALALSKKANFSEQLIKSLAESLADRCYLNKDYYAAAEINRVFLNDPSKSIDIYLEGTEYNRAFNLALSVNQDDASEKVKSHVIVAYSRLWKSIVTYEEEITKHSNRLKAIKESRVLKDDEDLYEDGNWETYSKEPSIVFSERSAKTTSSRKTEKRLWSLKEGNPREEIALYKQLHSNFTELYRLTEETKSVCHIMIRLNEIGQASKLQKHLKDAIVWAEQVKSVIWSCSGSKSVSDYEDVSVRSIPVAGSAKKSWEIRLLDDYKIQTF